MFSFLRKREEKNSRKILKKENPLRIIMEYPIEIFQKLSSQSSNTTQLQLQLSIRTFQRNEIFSSNHSACDEKGGKKEIACNAFRDCVVPSQVDLERVRGESREGCGHLSSRHLSERRPGEYRSVNERSPFPLARARAPTTTNPFPVGGSKVWRPWRPDGVRKNGEGHGFRARERMRKPRRRESESKGDRADRSLR